MMTEKDRIKIEFKGELSEFTVRPNFIKPVSFYCKIKIPTEEIFENLKNLSSGKVKIMIESDKE